MTTLNFRSNIILTESDATITKKINKALKKRMQKFWTRAAVVATEAVKLDIDKFIRESPTYLSFIAGDLQGHLGVPDSRAKMDILIDIWVNSVQILGNQVSTRIRKGEVQASFILTAIDASYEDVLASQAAGQITEKGEILPYLEWLLKKGNKIIIQTHKILLKTGKGRTSKGIMVKGATKSRWKIPSEHSGTPRSNFLTKSLDNHIDDISSTIAKVIESIS